jgi:diguanylate cyclase (GGDEF)-like protein
MDERAATNLCDLLTMHSEATAQADSSIRSTLYFIVLRGTIPGEMILLETGPKSLGRAPENEIQLPDMSVSRCHATLLVDDDGLAWLTDVGSTNGTFLNGQRLRANQTVGLRDGDRLGFGPSVVLKFARTDALDENHHREMFERSVRDPLTGLFNRAYFLNQMTVLTHRTYRNDLGLAVVMLDIDHFKQVNDTFGHDAGDEVLRHVAAVLRQSTRPSDLIARYGGEEFVAALPITSEAQAWELAERVRRSLKSKFVALQGGRPIQVTGSLGVAFSSAQSPRSIERLIAGADRALYEAKHLGRDRVMIDTQGRELVPAGDDDSIEIAVVDPSDPKVILGGLTTVDYEAYRDASLAAE